MEANRSLVRRILSAGLRWIVRRILRIKVSDTQCGFKIYTRDAAKRLHGAQTIMGFSFDLEILYLAFRWGYRVAEIPVSWVDSPGSKVDTRKEAQRFLRDMAKIEVNKASGVYEALVECSDPALRPGLRIAMVTADDARIKLRHLYPVHPR